MAVVVNFNRSSAFFFWGGGGVQISKRRGISTSRISTKGELVLKTRKVLYSF